MAETPESLPQRVEFLRKLAGLSSRGLAALAGLSPAYPRQIEVGDVKSVNVDVATKLANVFGLTLDCLVNGVDWPPDEADVLAAVGRAKAERGAA
jgi:transcriptional regulator with XRE-family HTH domain